jgi:hypothetical protein
MAAAASRVLAAAGHDATVDERDDSTASQPGRAW